MVAEFTRFWLGPASDLAYGLVRLGFALTSLSHLVALWPHRFYCLSSGMIDDTVSAAPLADWGIFRLLHGEDACTAAFVASAVFMVLFALGLASRLSAGVVAYWHLSLYIALAPAMSGYDHLLRFCSLILLISPLGTSCSFVAWRKGWLRGVPALPKSVPAYGLRLLQWQLFCIYLSTVWLKVPDPSWRNGEFISYFLLSIYSKWPVANWASWPGLSVILTFGTLATEVAIPFLLWQRRWRWLGMAMGFGLHLGIACTSNLGIFSWSMLMLYPAYLEQGDLTCWWSWVRKHIFGGTACAQFLKQ